MKPTACVIYGFGEGPRSGRKFIAALRAAGFETNSDPKTADVIIAHSGGCFLIPEEHQAKRIILIGLPYWPGKSLPSTLLQKTWLDARTHLRKRQTRRWFAKTAWNLTYTLRIDRNVAMLRARRAGTVWKFGDHTIVVRPYDDPFCTPDFASLPFTVAPQLVELPGQHDDCWQDPAPHITVVQSYYE